MKDERKHHGKVYIRSLEQQFRKSVVATFLCEKTGAVTLAQPGLTAGRQADEMLLHLEIFRMIYCAKH